MDVRFHVIWMFVFGRSMERTFGRSMIVRITSTMDFQVRKMDAIKTANRRKCASREERIIKTHLMLKQNYYNLFWVKHTFFASTNGLYVIFV